MTEAAIICSACLTEACFQGILTCEAARRAGITLTRRVARLGEPTVSGPDSLSGWCRFRFPLCLPDGWTAREAEVAPNGDLIVAASPAPS